MKLELFYVVKQIKTAPGKEPAIRYVRGPYPSFAVAIDIMNAEFPGTDHIIVSTVQDAY